MQNSKTSQKNTFWKVLLITLIIPFAMALNNTSASARSFGGHSTFHTSPTRSYHTSTYRTPSYHKSYHSYHSSNNKPKTYTTNRNHNTTVNQYHTKYYGNNSYHRNSGFGHSVANGFGMGLGWSLGSNVGNSVWHHAFGYGSNQYYDNYGHVQYGHRGYAGWIIIIIIVILVVYFIRRRNRNNRY